MCQKMRESLLHFAFLDGEGGRCRTFLLRFPLGKQKRGGAILFHFDFPWVKKKGSVGLLLIWLALGKGEGKGIGFFFRQPRREGGLSYDYYHPTMMTQEWYVLGLGEDVVISSFGFSEVKENSRGGFSLFFFFYLFYLGKEKGMRGSYSSLIRLLLQIVLWEEEGQWSLWRWSDSKRAGGGGFVLVLFDFQ